MVYLILFVIDEEIMVCWKIVYDVFCDVFEF